MAKIRGKWRIITLREGLGIFLYYKLLKWNTYFIDNTSLIALDFVDGSVGVGVCCNNEWSTANGQIVSWNFDTVLPTRDLKSGNFMNIWPNPAKDVLTIEFREGFGGEEIDIDIVASNGQVMERLKRRAKGRLEVIVLPLLRMINDHRMVAEKFIKE